MKTRIVRLLVAVALLMALAIPALAHTTPQPNHHGCGSSGAVHGIVTDSTNWGHRSYIQNPSQWWPIPGYDRVMDHYFRSTSSSPWYFLHESVATCWG